MAHAEIVHGDAHAPRLSAGAQRTCAGEILNNTPR